MKSSDILSSSSQNSEWSSACSALYLELTFLNSDLFSKARPTKFIRLEQCAMIYWKVKAEMIKTYLSQLKSQPKLWSFNIDTESCAP